jgi:hypothetical protein
MMQFILYSIFTSLARMFIDRQVRKHAARIFGMIDRELPSVFASGSPVVVDMTIARAISKAAEMPLNEIHPRQVQQVRDLFDPANFAARRAR